MPLDKTWDFNKELEILKEWDKLDLSNPGKEDFIIDTPPVYPSGEWHVGAVAGYVLIDIIARLERMRGKNVIFPFCLDRNGINIEQTVEKKYNKPLKDWDREKFLEECRKEIDKYSNKIKYIARRVGLSADFKDTYYETDSPEYRAFTQATFIELWKKGYIYEDYRPNFYCPGCRTTIAEAEIEYVEKETQLVYIRFKLKEDKGSIIVASTRPELLAGCGAILVHPTDKRYTHLHGKSAIVPIYGHEVKIIPHPYANPEFGTGAVMLCSYGDLADIRLFRELRLTPVPLIDQDGRMKEAAGKYKGLSVKEARAQIIDDLKKMGYVEKIEIIKHRTPVCSRSKDEIEFVSMKELYLKQLEFVDILKKLADQMVFRPPKYKQVLYDWMRGLSIDWPITRRRYYHTEVPLWYCKKCGATLIPPPGKYYRPWKDTPPFEKCPKCGAKEIIGDERVFDTWMDSSLTPLFVARYLRDMKFFKAHHPHTVMRPQGRDIIRTWLYYSLLKSYLHTGTPPFKWVFIHGMGLDKYGRKMSKSLGNIIPPLELIEKYGADSFRLWAAFEAGTNEDFRIDPARIDAARKFINKFWNIVRFISILAEKFSVEFPRESIKAKDVVEELYIDGLSPLETWSIAEINNLILDITPYLDRWSFNYPTKKIREFIKNTFASHFLELIKRKAYAGDRRTIRLLILELRVLLRLLAPFIPFITDYLYKRFFGRTIHKEPYPIGRQGWGTEWIEKGRILQEFNSRVWKRKKELGISLKAPIKGIEIPSELKEFEEDLRAMHNIQ